MLFAGVTIRTNLSEEWQQNIRDFLDQNKAWILGQKDSAIQ